MELVMPPVQKVSHIWSIRVFISPVIIVCIVVNLSKLRFFGGNGKNEIVTQAVVPFLSVIPYIC